MAQNKSHVESSLTSAGVPQGRADQIANAISHSDGGSASGFSERAGPRARELFESVQHDFELSSRTVFYVMAVSFVVAIIGMPSGRIAEADEPAAPEPAPAG